MNRAWFRGNRENILFFFGSNSWFIEFRILGGSAGSPLPFLCRRHLAGGKERDAPKIKKDNPVWCLPEITVRPAIRCSFENCFGFIERYSILSDWTNTQGRLVKNVVAFGVSHLFSNRCETYKISGPYTQSCGYSIVQYDSYESRFGPRKRERERDGKMVECRSAIGREDEKFKCTNSQRQILWVVGERWSKVARKLLTDCQVHWSSAVQWLAAQVSFPRARKRCNHVCNCIFFSSLRMTNNCIVFYLLLSSLTTVTFVKSQKRRLVHNGRRIYIHIHNTGNRAWPRVTKNWQ